MKLIDIDKTRYRRHLNRVLIGCGLVLAAGSLLVSQTLIALFPAPDGSHFHWNALGVLVAAAAIGLGLSKYRHHDYLTEVLYVWELKQSLNKITRKMRKLEAAAQEGDADALLALQYGYAGSRQLWKLDDNIIIMDELNTKQAQLDKLAARFNLTLNTDDYDDSILKRF
ncbi:DUF3087 domain-containing protein [Oceanisphaera sp. KMM 10153]|uniref:DUF3087 domain-containing protein n=1 Tax=Oceanisphaera submarina TaxID=3390193 RepID=UPI00397623D1